jgi:hypothetical protein
VAHIGDKRNACSVLVEKPEGKGPLGKPRCRWEDHIKICLKGIGWEDANWITLTHDRNKI